MVAEALPCAQQLLVFAPDLVNVRELLPELQAFLAHSPAFLRSGIPRGSYDGTAVTWTN